MNISASEARKNLPELIGRAGYGGERIIVARRGKVLAAIIGYADLKRLEALDDEISLELLRKAVAESERESLTLKELLTKCDIKLSDLDR
ncbi:MAG: type II toxin-antitoxin system Phd/YefM family antitoxin [Xenococcus sp. (in: cyanobacteria)]